MKLIHYTLRNLSVYLTVLLTIWAVGFYFAILYEVYDETNDTLENYKNIILRSVINDEEKLKNKLDLMTRYYINEVPESVAVLDKDHFYDATTYIEIEDEYEPVRVLQTYFKASNHKYYELRIELSTLERDDMLETISLSIALLYILLLTGILITVHLVFKKNFRPLYQMVEWLGGFRVGKKSEALHVQTSVDEFKILLEAVEESAKQNTILYNQQKQFIENVSHELQTPLAVCMNKLELLCENPEFTEEQVNEMGDLYRSISHMSKLNKSLLLLSRIENKQFADRQIIRLNPLVQEKTAVFSEMYAYKSLSVNVIEKGKLVCSINGELASILFTNLIKNAFIHTDNGGSIQIELTSDLFSITNSSNRGSLDTEKLFSRFNKQSDQKNSTGLGLAIVKSICDRLNAKVSYLYLKEKEAHQFKIVFNIEKE